MMKQYGYLLFVVFFIGCSLFSYAKPANSKEEWLGQWNLNHDGFLGTLVISDIKADCATTAWCSMTLSYTDSKGSKLSGAIERIEDNWQHMVFYINFPGNRQKFDAYLFSWDKKSMAGTTYWSNRTFGFYAAKKSLERMYPVGHNQVKAQVPKPPSPATEAGPQDPVTGRKILPDGTIETTYQSGKIRQEKGGTYTIIYPDGRRQTFAFSQVPAYVPPTAISDQNIKKWLGQVQASLLDMIKEKLLNDPVSVNNILSNETQRNLNVYEVINNRFYFLDYFNRVK